MVGLVWTGEHGVGRLWVFHVRVDAVSWLFIWAYVMMFEWRDYPYSPTRQFPGLKSLLYSRLINFTHQ